MNYNYSFNFLLFIIILVIILIILLIILLFFIYQSHKIVKVEKTHPKLYITTDYSVPTCNNPIDFKEDTFTITPTPGSIVTYPVSRTGFLLSTTIPENNTSSFTFTNF